MRKVLKWVGLAAGGLAVLALTAIAAIFLLSEQSIASGFEPQPEALPRPSVAMLADAPRQARILGCVACHGEGLKGNLMVDIPNVARVYAPNLTQVAAQASDQQLAAAIRQGVGHDGRSLFVMPSQMYSRLTAEETAALVAWIRAQPRQPGSPTGIEVGPLGRLAVVTGKFRPAAAKIEEFRTQVPIDMGPALAAGRRIAGNACSECHGPALFGMTMEDGQVTPDLTLAGAYDPADFRTLMRTGRGAGGRDLGLMSKLALKNFSQLTDAEIEALHAYLKARAERLSN